MPDDRKRPATNGAHPGNDLRGGGSSASVPPDPAAVAAFRGAYGVLVRTGDRSTRSLFLSLSAAQRKAERVRARGGDADLVLLRMLPVDARHLDLLGGGQ